MEHHRYNPLTSLQELRSLLSARLSRRVALWVFASLVLIEAIVLVPSVWQRRQERLNQLTAMQRAQLLQILSDRPLSAEALMAALDSSPMDTLTGLEGGQLYFQGRPTAAFGPASAAGLPEATPMGLALAGSDATPVHLADLSHRDGYYQSVWQVALDDQQRHTLVLLHSDVLIRRQLRTFVLQVIGLVAVISLFVTASTVIVVGWVVIVPILRLRRDLQWAGEAAGHTSRPQFEAQDTGDELGDVITAFQQMFERICGAIADRKQAQQALLIAKKDAEAASQAKSAFLAKISHQLRPSLDAIVSYSETLHEQALAMGEDDLTADLEKIQAEGEQVLALVNSSLDPSKPESAAGFQQ